MNAPGALADVMRNMRIEAVPVRLLRAASDMRAEDNVAEQDAAVAEERRRSYDEGFQAGSAQGREEGYREGLRRGEAETASGRDAAVRSAVEDATSALRQQAMQLATLVQGIDAAMAEVLCVAEDEFAALCFDAICRVIGPLAARPGFLAEHLGHLLALASRMDDLVALRLHPADVERVQREAIAMPPSVRLVADATVQLGGCIASGTRGALDLRLETMLESLRAAVLQGREGLGVERAP